MVQIAFSLMAPQIRSKSPFPRGSARLSARAARWSSEARSSHLRSPPPTSSPPSQHRRCYTPRRPPRRAIHAPAAVARAQGTRGHGHDGGAQPRPQQRRRRARPSPPTASTTFREALAAHGRNAELTSRHGSGAELAPCHHGRGTELAPRRHGRKAELASRHG